MKISFSKEAKGFLLNNKKFIAQDNPRVAKSYTEKLIQRIVKMLQFPNIGKVNLVFDDESIREISLDGMKVIYKKYPNSVVILMVYRNINFDESSLGESRD